MKIKTKDLTGAALDWAMAKADENLYPKGDVRLLDGKVFTIEPGNYEQSDRWQLYDPSTSWAQGGPIIEREKIGTDFLVHGFRGPVWYARIGGGDCMYGPTPLIAAMRCLVASKLGDEVDVPEELM